MHLRIDKKALNKKDVKPGLWKSTELAIPFSEIRNFGVRREGSVTIDPEGSVRIVDLCRY